jgi:hypothetical protein
VLTVMLAELMIPTMNAALVVGVGAVMPLSLKARPVPWVFAAGCVVISLLLPAGWLAGAFVAPWVVLTVFAGVGALRRGEWWLALVAGFAGTASLALTFSRLELTLFGIVEPIVKLTALHFTYAGAGTLALALRVHEVRPGRWSSVARVLVLLAPPVVASGFILRSALGQVGGATLMTAGVWLVALLQVADVRRGGKLWWLWLVSCLSPLVAMVLGVSWAANQYWPQVPALIVPDMVPTHGALNAFGFVLGGHLACWLEWRHSR